MSKLLDKFGLIVEHSKTEVFHFNRSYNFSNPLLSTSQLLKDLFLCLRIRGNTWASSLIGSSYSINILIITRTKPYPWSSAWSSLVIHCAALFRPKSAYSIGAASYTSHYMAINYGSITMLLYYTIWKSCRKCKEELSYGYLELLKHLQLKALKQLQELFPSNCTFKNLQIDHNYTHSLYPLTILFKHLQTIFLVCPFTNIQPYSTISPVTKDLLSKVIWSIQTTKCMEFFFHFLLCIWNFFQVLESLTIF